MNVLHARLARQGLLRSADDRLLGGVCAGLARRFGMDPWAVRALFIATLVVVPGSQVLVYPLLWVLMPEEGAAATGRSAQHPVV
ncbi:PspC domain-containing protein [Kineococcus sp. SYSU DK006]|uniref:PspC domain-containing protein n=1 Tax=Kineococcus sp. SYSU DK006 TaxID=3383127 RepID=UPI003D7D33EC